MAKKNDNPIKTLVIDNFRGSIVPRINGDINNGYSYWFDVFAYDVFSKPGNLTWHEAPIQIDAAGTVITDLIMAGKVRMESGTLYVYAIGHLGRLYKIQVNDTATSNPDYDIPVLLTTITSGTPTFTRGGFIDFFGSTEQIYIGHDKGVTRINFDGTGETVVGVAGSWTATVPRPLQQFGASLYAGNGTNLTEIIGAGTVATYSKLSPAFPIGTQVRDIKLTPDGNYVQVVVTRLALSDMTATTPDTTLIAPTDSYLFKWNGIDAGYTSYTYYPSTILNAVTTFSDSQYVFGYDTVGQAVYNPIRKIFSELPNSLSGTTYPNAINSIGNLVQWATTLPYLTNTYALFLHYGILSDYDHDNGLWAPVFMAATSPETDVMRIPCQIMISNTTEGTSSSGYTNNIIGTSKVYFSTLETSSGPTTDYKLYKWFPFPTGLHDSELGVFQTQNQLFSKKIQIHQVRIYGQPWVANNSFIIDLIGSDDAPITNGSQTFTVGTNLTVGNDFAWYSPAIKPVYSLALRVTNNGTANHIINKIEIDYSSGGQ